MELEECKKKAVGMLLSYQDNLLQIKMLEAELTQLDAFSPSNMAVNYDQPSGGKTNKVNSPVETSVEQRAEEREKLINELRQRRINQRKIDIALDNMSLEKKLLLRMRFIERRMWKEIAQQIDFSEEYIRKELRDSAVNMLTGYLYPHLCLQNLFTEMPHECELIKKDQNN